MALDADAQPSANRRISGNLTTSDHHHRHDHTVDRVSTSTSSFIWTLLSSVIRWNPTSYSELERAESKLLEG